jgi:uncharacterized lipoprotein YmbA
MRRANSLQLLGLMCGAGLLLGGCLIKPGRLPTRHFVLAAIPAPEPAPAAAQPWPLEVGFVKMPDYLLRDSIVVRKSDTEIEYLEEVLWAERLDQSFRQTLADNLSTLLRSNQLYASASERDRAMVKVSVEVKQFDVNTQGRGTLIAWWRVTGPGGNKTASSGEANLSRTGASPRGNPQVIATTLSELAAEFSQELAQAIRESAKVKP